MFRDTFGLNVDTLELRVDTPGLDVTRFDSVCTFRDKSTMCEVVFWEGIYTLSGLFPAVTTNEIHPFDCGG